ncbi:MarR family winged helix-turn-helix transcriptional regulator [Brachybacterium tyrofermentans]|uniref:MarR family winged helix-turn-helix transcriptional regulator n=1 Tax=Brachybacterium tyrofermentans TaxID=47848 RepID=A0ABW0FKD4_9MICO
MVESVGETSGSSGGSYWYDGGDSGVDLLSALREFRTADHDMRRRMSADMEMNTTDLSALRYVIAHEVGEDPATPQALARNLGISGASTSKLLDRLTGSGHLERVPHPRDGRSRVVVATDHAHTQVRERLAGMHERMLEIAHLVPPSARPAAIEFLRAMARHLETEAPPEELTAREV